VLFSAETRNVVVTERRFQLANAMGVFIKKNHKHYDQFNDDGSVLERKHCRLSSMHSLENIDTVRVALQRSRSKSTRMAAAQLWISRQLVQRILKSDLNLYPYK
jgi:hypothetical protein